MNTTQHTADLHDQHPDQFQVADNVFKHYGNKTTFQGQIQTLKVDNDFGLIKQTLATNGQNKVLIIDGNANPHCALLGDRLTTLAIKNQWAGIIINGCLRDSQTINTLPIAIKALNTSPIKPNQTNAGEQNIPLTFANITFTPNHYIYADLDGILISQQQHS